MNIEIPEYLETQNVKKKKINFCIDPRTSGLADQKLGNCS